MKYFVLKQDKNLENAIELEEFNNSQKMILLKEDEQSFKDTANVIVKGTEDSVYPDFIQAPVLLVSDELHNVFKWYEDTLIYKIAVFTNLELKTQRVYRLVLTDIVEGLSEKTTYLKNGWVDKIVLDKEKIGDYNIFQIKAGVEYYFVVSLDVAESILKRGFIGTKFKEVEVR